MSFEICCECASLLWHSRSAPNRILFILLALNFSVQLSVDDPAKLESRVDYTASALKGVGATIEGLFDDAVGTVKSFWESPFGTVYDIGYAFTVGRAVDALLGARFAWDYAWGTGTARSDAEQLLEQIKRTEEEEGRGYYTGYIVSQAASYLTLGKLLKSKNNVQDGPDGKDKTEGTGIGDKDNYFIGTLKGEKIHLKGVKVEEIIYTKRLPEETAKFRKEFNSSVRKNFLKEFANDPVRVEYLKKAGLGEDDISRMKDGLNPKGWQVHHNLPLDDGGTNDFINLVLIKNDPYHKAVTNEQNTLTRGLAPKQSEKINWPIFEDDVYPPKPFKRKEE